MATAERVWTEKYIQMSHGRTRYWEAGTGAPTILLHGAGWNSGCENWALAMGPLSQRLRCLAIDCLNWGTGDVLEPEVVAARVYGHGPPLWREVFRQVNKLIAQLHAHDAHPRAEDALQPLVFAARRFDVRDFFKRQNLGEKLH